MRAPAAKPQADVVARFRQRCASTAAAWAARKLDLHAAVNGLAAWAASHGIDTDVAQHIMSAAFKPHRRPNDRGLPP